MGATNTDTGTLTKVIEMKGKYEALMGAISATVMSAVLFYAGVLKRTREKELKSNPGAASSRNSADKFPASWILFTFAPLFLLFSWLWFYLTRKTGLSH